MSKMNPKLKTKWIEKLRSGEIKQGFLFLERSDHSQCCLGVLCNILNTPKRKFASSRNEEKVFEFEDHTRMPPFSVLEKSRLSNDDVSTLAKMNDHGKTFQEISDYIETNL